MPHQDTPLGIHIEHPRSKHLLNYDKMQANTRAFAALVAQMIDSEKQPLHKQKALRMDSLVFALALSGQPQVWRDERISEMKLAQQYGVMPERSQVTITSHQQPDGSQQGRCNVLGKHMEGDL